MATMDGSVATLAKAGTPIISVELADSSIFKFPLNSSTTPRNLFPLIAKKAVLIQYTLFGLASTVPEDARAIIGTSTNALAEPESSYFLMDDVPIVEQMNLSNTSKATVSLALKYCFQDLKTELEDVRALQLVYREFTTKFRNSASAAQLPNEPLRQFAIYQIHCLPQKPSVITADTLRTVLPINIPSSFFHESQELLDHVNSGLQELVVQSLTFQDVAQQFLALLRKDVPRLFWTCFEATHLEPLHPVELCVGYDGIRLAVDKDKSSPTSAISYYLPLCFLSSWNMTCIDDPNQQSSKMRAQKGEMAEATHSIDALSPDKNDYARTIGSSNTIHTSSLSGNVMSTGSGLHMKNNFLRKHLRALPKKSMDSLSPKAQAEKPQVQYHLTFQAAEDYLGAFELLYSSTRFNDFRIVELLDFYSARHQADVKAAKKKSNITEDSVIVVDDPEKFADPIRCIAKQDYVATNESDLMFLAGEEILVIKKLNNDLYLGSCQGVEGLFRASHVEFPKKRFSIHEKQKHLKYLVSGGKTNELITVFLLDDTRRTFRSHPGMTPAQLMQKLCEKLELTDPEFFDLAAVEKEQERWLLKEVPLTEQGVGAQTRLLFKLRILYRDVNELTESSAINLYYSQVKNFIIHGLTSINENQVIEFASYQLQATFGDFEQEKVKGISGSLNLFLPMAFQKMTLSRNETWWLKRFMAAHQQHRGLSKLDAQKAYIAMAQTLPLTRFQTFTPLSPDMPLLGISRDHVVLVDRGTKNILEKYDLDFKNLVWRNHSLMLDLSMRSDDGDRNVRFVSLETVEIMHLLSQMAQAETLAALRKKCRQLRDKFSALGIDLDMGDLGKFHTEPSLFILSLSNGVALSVCAKILRDPAPTIASLGLTENYPASATTSPTTVALAVEPSVQDDISVDITATHISAFLAYCREELKMSPDELFTVEDLQNTETTDHNKILNVLQEIFNKDIVRQKVTHMQEYNKAKRAKFGGKSPAGQSTMTTADLRKKVMEELLSTEKNYSQDLDKIVGQYIRLLQELAAKRPEAVEDEMSVEDVLSMFSNISEMAGFHRDFVGELEKYCAGTEQLGEIGLSFYKRGDQFIKLYEFYCSDHAETVEKNVEIKSSPEVLAILGMNGEAQTDQVAKHNLASQLIKPVQRIMRYHLLLKELLKYTPEDHPGYADLEKGLRKAKEVASCVNEIKRRKENERTLQALQSRIENFEGPLLTTLGPLIQDGKLTMVEKGKASSSAGKDAQLSFFLFEELLVYCKEMKRGKNVPSGYKFKGYIPVYTLTLKEQILDAAPGDDAKLMFELSRSDVSKQYWMTAATHEDRDRWITTLTKCIKICAEKPADAERNAKFDGLRTTAKQIWPFSNTNSNSGNGSRKTPELETEQQNSPSLFGFNISVGSAHASPRKATMHMELDVLAEQVGGLKAQLQAESAARLALQEQVGRLTEQVQFLQQQMKALTGESTKDAQGRRNSSVVPDAVTPNSPIPQLKITPAREL